MTSTHESAFTNINMPTGKRVSRLACDACRQQKIRCIRSNLRQKCQRCVRNRNACFTSASRPPGRPPNSRRAVNNGTDASSTENDIMQIPEDFAASSLAANQPQSPAKSLPLSTHSLADFVDLVGSQTDFNESRAQTVLSDPSAFPLAIEQDDPSSWLLSHSLDLNGNFNLHPGVTDSEESSSLSTIEGLSGLPATFMNKSGNIETFQLLTFLLSEISQENATVKSQELGFADLRLSSFGSLYRPDATQGPKSALERILLITTRYVLLLQMLAPIETERPASPQDSSTTTTNLILISAYLHLLTLLVCFFSKVQGIVSIYVSQQSQGNSLDPQFRTNVMRAIQLFKHQLGLAEVYLGLPKESRHWVSFTMQVGILNNREASILSQESRAKGSTDSSQDVLEEASQLLSMTEYISYLLR